MEGSVGSRFGNMDIMVKKKRSSTSRRPRPDPVIDSCDSLLLSTPPSDNVSKGSNNENIGRDTASRKKEFNLNQCASNISYIDRGEGEAASEGTRKDVRVFGKRYASFGNDGSRDGELRQSADFKCSNESVYALGNRESKDKINESIESQSRKLDDPMGSERSGEGGLGNHNKVRKVKLKVGGVTRTIHTITMPNGSSAGAVSTESLHCSNASRYQQSMDLQETLDGEHPSLKGSRGLQGVPWKDFSGRGFSLRKDDYSRHDMARDSLKKTDKSETVRKNKRVPKKRVFDEAFDDDDEDEEIRYLERHRISKNLVDCMPEYKDNGEGNRNHRKIRKDIQSKMIDGEFVDDQGYGSLKSGRDGWKNSRSERESEETDYVEEEEPTLDGVLETRRREQKESGDLDGKRERSLTTRQRALLSGRDGSTVPDSNSVEFPNGLPPAPPRKQKEKLSEVEQQLKKVEAAQRRKMQVEKAAREAEAEAIRKILGQDSTRKKQEDKMKKRRDELAQEKAANANILPPNTIRWVSNPNGNFITFSNDIGMPSMFEPRPRGHPSPREKCAGPTCTNPYKYRDSKTNLPLCSLQCYKAIHEQEQPASTS